MKYQVFRFTFLVLVIAGLAMSAYGQGNGPAGLSNTPGQPQSAPPNSPSNRQQPSTSPSPTQQPSSNRSTSGATTESPAIFSGGAALRQAMEMNAAEVELGKTASSKAQNARVKSFAEMMVKDHTDALSKLRAIPGGPSAEIKPNAEHQKVADHLSKLSGAQFDRAYMNEMVSGHQMALQFFEQQAKSSSGTTSSTTNANANTRTSGNTKTLAQVSEELLPAVRMHLQEAQDIQKELGGRTSTNTKNNSNTTNSNSTQSPANTR